MLRARFAEQMSEIHKALVEGGQVIESALESASQSISTGKGFKKTAKYEHKTDEMEDNIESLCFHLLSTQQPVAGDLRLISAALKIISDMERIGDLCRDIALLSPEFSETMDTSKIMLMCKTASEMVKLGINAFVAADTNLAFQAIESDSYVDSLFFELKNDLIKAATEHPHLAASAMDFLLAAKIAERIADHACNIAQWVIYALTGERRGAYG
ncbi:MAG: phosphate signaling complex protein PhoU [Deferribacteraceae bacterium]|jgi:phosphate transport system protein|nr:phosphate signaling complex protein PhoU [Deferribacteraceae bacterium]